MNLVPRVDQQTAGSQQRVQMTRLRRGSDNDFHSVISFASIRVSFAGFDMAP